MIVVDGPSTVQVWLAGVGSTVPAVLTARTRSVCVPTVRPSMHVVRLAVAEGAAVERALEARREIGRGEAEVGGRVQASKPAGAESIVVSGATTVHA